MALCQVTISDHLNKETTSKLSKSKYVKKGINMPGFVEASGPERPARSQAKLN